MSRGNDNPYRNAKSRLTTDFVSPNDSGPVVAIILGIVCLLLRMASLYSSHPLHPRIALASVLDIANLAVLACLLCTYFLVARRSIGALLLVAVNLLMLLVIV